MNMIHKNTQFFNGNSSYTGFSLSQFSNTWDSIFEHEPVTGSISEPMGSSVYLRQRDLIRQLSIESVASQESIARDSPPAIFIPKKLYRGVRQRHRNKWVAEIRLPQNRMRVWLGTYETAEAAAYAYDRTAYKLRREYAKLNFPKLQNPARLGLSDARIESLNKAVDAKIENIWQKVKRQKKIRRATAAVKLERSSSSISDANDNNAILAGSKVETSAVNSYCVGEDNNGDDLIWSAAESGSDFGSDSSDWRSVKQEDGDWWSLDRLPGYDPDLIWEVLAAN